MLPDHFAGLITEYARRGGIPGGDLAVQCLADDGIVRRGDDRGNRAWSAFWSVRSISTFKAPMIRPASSFNGVGYGRKGTRVPSGLSTTASTPRTGYPSFSVNGHRALVMWQRPPVGPIETPGAAP